MTDCIRHPEMTTGRQKSVSWFSLDHHQQFASREASEERLFHFSQDIFPCFLAPHLVSLCLSMHPQWEGQRPKEKMQVREPWMQLKENGVYLYFNPKTTPLWSNVFIDWSAALTVRGKLLQLNSCKFIFLISQMAFPLFFSISTSISFIVSYYVLGISCPLLLYSSSSKFFFHNVVKISKANRILTSRYINAPLCPVMWH